MQTDFSKAAIHTSIASQYEQYVQGVDRLNKALNAELKSCHKHIDSLIQDIDRLERDISSQRMVVRELYTEKAMLLQRSKSLAWLECSLKDFVTKMQAKFKADVYRQSTISDEEIIMNGLMTQDDVEELKRSIVRSRLQFVDPNIQALLNRYLNLFELLLAQNKSMEQNHNILSQAADRNTEQIDVLINKIIQLEGQKTQLTSKTENTVRQMQNYRDAVSELQSQLSQEKQQSEYLQSELEHAQGTINEMRQHITHLQCNPPDRLISDDDIEQRDEIMIRLEQQYQQKQKLYQFIDELKLTIEDLNRNIEINKLTNNKKDNTSKSDIHKLNIQMAKLKKQNIQLKDTITKIEKKKNQYHSELITVRKQKDDQHRQLIDFKSLWKQDQNKMRRAEKEIEMLKSQLSQQYSHVSSELLNMSDEGRYHDAKISDNMSSQLSMQRDTFDHTNLEHQQKENSPKTGSPVPEVDKWNRLQERIQYRKQYTDSLNKNLSFKVLKLRN